MAPNSVDDQYEGCKEEMADFVKTKYLKTEINNSVEFNNTWHDGENKAKNPEDHLKQIHSVAIYVYTNNNSDVYRHFNNALRSERQKYKDETFTWYSLHFLLTECGTDSEEKLKTNAIQLIAVLQLNLIRMF